MENVDETDDNTVDATKFPNYNLTKMKSKEDGKPTLLELQRSSAVISGHKNQRNSIETIQSMINQSSATSGGAWLCHLDHRIVNIVIWKDTTKSLLTFLWIITSLFMLRTHSLVYLATASLLSVLIIMLLFVGGCTLLQAATTGHVVHPFAAVLAKTITISESMQGTISMVMLSIITGSVDFIARIVLVQSFGLTFRSVALLWLIWAHVEDVHIFLIIIVCVIFTLPKLYTDHSETYESLLEEIYEENPISGIISAHFKIKESSGLDSGTRKDNIISLSKDMISASLSGIIIVLFVKYFLSDEQGKIPNLFYYFWSS